MKTAIVILMLQCVIYLVIAQEDPETKDLGVGDEDYDDIGRKHKKRKKHQNNPCYGGYGKTFGEKFAPHDYTYINAPVTNYFFGCGGAPAPAPVQYPAQFGGHGHGHGGHGHGHGHGHGGVFQGGYQGFQGGYQGFQGPVNYGYNQGYPNQYQNYNRPLQNVVSAAASGLGNAVAGYFNRPRKVNRQVNQLFKPLYQLI